MAGSKKPKSVNLLNNNNYQSMISVAPMLRLTNRHCRYFHRLLAQRALLYTEMYTTGAVLHADPQKLLEYNSSEHPLAIQLAGANPIDLAICAQIAVDFGYDEINLNLGCPSKRIQAAKFGACLLQQPKLAADCVAAMAKKVSTPISIKTRLGVVGDFYQNLLNFVKRIADVGCRKFIIHARQVNLASLNPKKNRQSSLNYQMVYQLKQDLPDLTIIINGNIINHDQITEHVRYVDGVMLGRAAYRNPYLLADIDQKFYSSKTEPLSREEIFQAYLPYIQEQLTRGVSKTLLTRHLYGLYYGMPNAKNWRVRA